MLYWTDYNMSDLIPLPVRDRIRLYDDNVFSLDVETTSIFATGNELGVFDYSKPPEFYKTAEKFGILYIWQMSINHVVVYGRTLSELDLFLRLLRKQVLGRIIIYIHNLAYEFQFLRNIITDFEVFARKPRHPIKAYSPDRDIEFRCSLMLTNMSLEKLPKAMGLNIEKLTGLLDYNKLRLPCTDLTPDELRYCEYDCLVLWHALSKYKTDYEHVYNIPLTQTGRLRRAVKTMYKSNNAYYRKLVKILPVTFPEFNLLCKSYSGGYTHANALHSRQILENVYSCDIASSYPTVMVCERFPMSRFIPVKLRSIDDMDPRYSYIIDITFTDLRASVSYTYLSKSKAVEVYNAYEDNGRVVTAQRIRYILTEIDLSIVQQSYHYNYEINAAYVAHSERLDSNLVRYIVKLYNDKTRYKGIPDKSDLYARSKEFINSMYGMCVTNIIRDEVIFTDSWGILPITIDAAEEKLLSLTKRRKTFLSYAWGVYVTAYARRNLWRVILQMPDDVVYVDTDSIKYLNVDNGIYFDQYNAGIMDQLKNAAQYHNIPIGDLMPIDINGIPRILGVYEREGRYDKFVTLGAKKYCIEQDGKLEITISGVSKSKGVSALHSITDFNEGLTFDYTHSGRLVMTYNDDQPDMELTDYHGKKIRISQRYGINAMPTTYTLDISVNYDEYITRLSGTSSTHTKLLED